MTEPQNIQRSREQIHHMKMATLKDWLLNTEQEYINVHVDSNPPSNTTSPSSSPQQQDISDFEFYNEEKKKQHSHSAASSADEIFLEGKLIPLETVQKNHHNNNAVGIAATTTAAIDGVRSLSCIEERAIPPHTITVGSADDDSISPPHSGRFSSSDLNLSECMFSEFPGADSTKRSWSLRLKQSKQSKNNYSSWLIQKIKASRTLIKSFFSNNNNSASPSSDKEKCCRCSDSTVGSAPKENLETINKTLHDNDIGGGSVSRRRRRRRATSFSGVLKRHFSSKKGSNLMMVTSAEETAAAVNSSSGSSWSKRCDVSVSGAADEDDVEKSVDAAIAYCKLSLQKGSEQRIAPKVVA